MLSNHCGSPKHFAAQRSNGKGMGSDDAIAHFGSNDLEYVGYDSLFTESESEWAPPGAIVFPRHRAPHQSRGGLFFCAFGGPHRPGAVKHHSRGRGPDLWGSTLRKKHGTGRVNQWKTQSLSLMLATMVYFARFLVRMPSRKAHTSPLIFPPPTRGIEMQDGHE